MTDRFDTIIVGGGHNGLVAAAYLARAGRDVLVLERAGHTGGAAVSTQAFKGVDARLSRYSYLVSLLPEQIVSDLGLDLELRSRSVASYSPAVRENKPVGLLVERRPGAATEASFQDLTGSDRDYRSWQAFYAEWEQIAAKLAPTMLEPLRTPEQIRELVGDRAWSRYFCDPIGVAIEEDFADDLVRGVVLTDALIGTFSHAHDPSLVQNRCFLYHLVGNGTGEWRVPVGGMGAVTRALDAAARRAGATIRTDAEVVRIESDGHNAEVAYIQGESEHRVAATNVLSGVAPATLDVLLGRTPQNIPEGSQVKVNFVLKKLPRLKSGVDPRSAFAGTFHVAESYSELSLSYKEASAGRFPSGAPAELYCHTLTDPSILGDDLAQNGTHTLTLFGLHTPARLFTSTTGGNAPQRTVGHFRSREGIVSSYLKKLNEHLLEPIEECLAEDAEGRPCIETKTPLDIEAAVGMPGGHIFHGDLAWPWADSSSVNGNEQGDLWGVETDIPNVLICGAGARRGGGVSGIGGHNAAHALLANRNG